MGIDGGLDEDVIDDVHDAIVEQQVRLDDERGDVAGGDVLPGGVDAERERLARGGRLGATDEFGGVHRGTVNELQADERAVVSAHVNNLT